MLYLTYTQSAAMHIHMCLYTGAGAAREKEKEKEKEKAAGTETPAEEGADEKEPQTPPPELMTLDPDGFALLPLLSMLGKHGGGKPDASKQAGQTADDDKGEGQEVETERVRIKYVKVDTTFAWTSKNVTEEVRSMRGHDEERELAIEAASSQARMMTLDLWFNNPPPLWRIALRASNPVTLPATLSYDVGQQSLTDLSSSFSSCKVLVLLSVSSPTLS